MAEKPGEYEALLREAIKKAKETAPRAVDDLVEFASSVADAVSGVTGGRASLELVPMADAAPPAYKLQLRKVGSEAPPTDLGIYQVSTDGYPCGDGTPGQNGRIIQINRTAIFW